LERLSYNGGDMEKKVEERLHKISQLINNALNNNEELNAYACELKKEGVGFGLMIQAAVNFDEAPEPTEEEIKAIDNRFLSALRISMG